MFKEIIRTPIYFNLSTQIFIETVIKSLSNLPTDEENLQGYLVETFTEKQMSDVSAEISFIRQKQTLSFMDC